MTSALYTSIHWFFQCTNRRKRNKCDKNQGGRSKTIFIQRHRKSYGILKKEEKLINKVQGHRISDQFVKINFISTY